MPKKKLARANARGKQRRQVRSTNRLSKRELNDLLRLIEIEWQKGNPDVLELVGRLRQSPKGRRLALRNRLRVAWAVIGEFTVKLGAEYLNRLSKPW